MVCSVAYPFAHHLLLMSFYFVDIEMSEQTNLGCKNCNVLYIFVLLLDKRPNNRHRRQTTDALS